MRFVIVTGMSGAGKTSVLKFLEDANFYSIDNMPPALIPKFAELCYEQGGEIERVAMGIDIRGGKLFDDLFNVLSSLEDKGYEYEILFLETATPTLIKRFKESRRSHPLARKGTIEEGINKERELLKEVKSKATFIIDTSKILARDLKSQINRIFLENKQFDSLVVNISSFGFKYGIPVDSDLVFDVRFLPNPYYIQELKEFTGNDKCVYEYVMSFDESQEFLRRMVDMIEFLLPLYVKEGKNSLVISIGCTGGKHRSVTLVNHLFDAISNGNHTVIKNHNDIEKDFRNKK